MKSSITRTCWLVALCTLPTLASATEGGVPALQQDLLALTSRVDTINADLQSTKADLQTTKVALAQTKSELAGTKSDLAATKTDLAATKANLAATQSDLVATKVELAADRQALAQTQIQLDDVEMSLRSEVARLQQDLLAAVNDTSTATSALFVEKVSKTELADKEQTLKQELASKVALQEQKQVLEQQLASKVALQEQKLALEQQLASKAELAEKEQMLKQELASKQAVDGVSKTQLAGAAEQMRVKLQAALLTGFVTGGGVLPTGADTDEVLDKMQATTDAFAQMANLPLVDDLGQKTQWTEAAGRAAAEISAARQAKTAGGAVETTRVLDKLVGEIEQQMSKLGDDAQLANIDLQQVLQKQQQVLQMMSNIEKQLHDTAMAIIRKIGG